MFLEKSASITGGVIVAMVINVSGVMWASSRRIPAPHQDQPQTTGLQHAGTARTVRGWPREVVAFSIEELGSSNQESSTTRGTNITLEGASVDSDPGVTEKTPAQTPMDL